MNAHSTVGVNRYPRAVEARQSESRELLMISGRHVTKDRQRGRFSQLDAFSAVRAIVDPAGKPAQADVRSELVQLVNRRTLA
jgi:hypothetical protein